MLKQEFSMKKTWLNLYEDEESMVKSWILPSWVLLALRFIMALFCVAIIIISGFKVGSAKWFIYLTYWSFLLLTMAMLGLSILSIIHALEQMDNVRPGKTERNDRAQNGDVETGQNSWTSISLSETHVWYHKFVWYLWIISSNAAVVVTLNYWVLVFSPPTDFMDIAVHAVNSAMMLTELFLGSIPVRILHGIYVVKFAFIYGIFTVVYWAAGGKDTDGNPYIYKVLDYGGDDSATAFGVLIATILVISPVVQLFLFGLYQLRSLFSRKVSSSKVDKQEDAGQSMRSI